MSIKVGHSSKDESGKITGGVSGDQNNKEVCTRNWYNGGWDVVVRPKTQNLAEKSAKACEAACANPNIGYDQNQRNTLNTQAKAVGYDLSKITIGCECDCSSFMHVCAIAGGANVKYSSNGCTTRNIASTLAKSGDYEELTDSKYLTSYKYLRRGDILVKKGSHTVMVLENGAYAEPFVQTAPVATPSTTQTKNESTSNSTSSASSSSTTTATVYYSVRLPVLKKGSENAAVKNCQNLLLLHGEKLPRYGADGEFGSETESAIKNHQKKKGLKITGSCDADTWLSLITT